MRLCLLSTDGSGASSLLGYDPRRLRHAFAIVLCLVIASSASASEPVARPNGVPSDVSRWSSFVRIVLGRWDVRAKSLRRDADGARRQFRNCVNDAWFVANSALLSQNTSPCPDLARSAHEKEDDGTAPATLVEKFRAQFANAASASDYSAYKDCIDAAFDYHDSRLFAACAQALRPRERVLSTLSDEERFNTWLGGCKQILLAEARPVESSDGEAIKTPKKALTEFEKTQGRHCFRTLPALYEVRGMKKLSDFWTPEEQKLLYLRSKQLGQN